MTSGGSQVSYYWNGKLQINKRKGYNIHVMVDQVGDIITNYLYLNMFKGKLEYMYAMYCQLSIFSSYMYVLNIIL